MQTLNPCSARLSARSQQPARIGRAARVAARAAAAEAPATAVETYEVLLEKPVQVVWHLCLAPSVAVATTLWLPARLGNHARGNGGHFMSPASHLSC